MNKFCENKKSKRREEENGM